MAAKALRALSWLAAAAVPILFVLVVRLTYWVAIQKPISEGVGGMVTAFAIFLGLAALVARIVWAIFDSEVPRGR